ncbi:MAG: alpha/beta hydrolase [Dehalococcoidia bacterium]
MTAVAIAALDGVDVAYREEGDGFPVVFCHEFAGSMESWDLQVSYFARRYRTIVYNARGYPPSGVPESPDAYEQAKQEQTLYLLLRHLGIEQAFICGLSMGSHTALGFVIAHPEMCKGVIAAGAGTGSVDPALFTRDSEQRAALLLQNGTAGLQDYVASSTRARFKQKDPAGWELFAGLFMRHSAQGSANTLRGFQARRPSLYAREAELARLQVPTLIVTGDEDDPCLEPSLFLKRVIPRSGLVVLPQTGHACNIEEPALFNQAVAEFLAMVEAGKWTRRPRGTGEAWTSTGQR